MKIKNITQLVDTAQEFKGATIGELAQLINFNLKPDMKFAKGCIGVLFEKLLGATAGSLPIPDFPELGVELKTIPVDKNLIPLESTYVCIANQLNVNPVWQKSVVYLKTRMILWIPVISAKDMPPEHRVVANPILWSPNDGQEFLLHQDWQEITEMLLLGLANQINSRMGKVLQLRPKGATSCSVAKCKNSAGEISQSSGRGFYLRRSFTKSILL